MKRLGFILIGIILTGITFSQPYLHGVVSSSGGGGEEPTYETEFQALLDAWTNDPTGSDLTDMNLFVDSMKYFSIWDSLDVFMLGANHSNSDDESLYNWITATNVADGEFTWTQYEGWKFDGIDDSITTGYDADDEGLIYSLNYCSMGAWINSDYNQDSRVCGASSSYGTYIAPEDSYGDFTVRANGSGVWETGYAANSGFCGFNKKDDSTIGLHHNGTDLGDQTPSTNELNNYEIYIGCDNAHNGPAINHTTAEISAFWMGGALSDAQMAHFYRLLNRLITALQS
jgi:hypothetical protein